MHSHPSFSVPPLTLIVPPLAWMRMKPSAKSDDTMNKSNRNLLIKSPPQYCFIKTKRLILCRVVFVGKPIGNSCAAITTYFTETVLFGPLAKCQKLELRCPLHSFTSKSAKFDEKPKNKFTCVSMEWYQILDFRISQKTSTTIAFKKHVFRKNLLNSLAAKNRTPRCSFKELEL